MHKHFIKTPWLVRKIFSNYVWALPSNERKVYLTFDDGPHPHITPFMLNELKQFNAQATFFCIGKNVLQYPEVYQQILKEGHAVGNHTHNHLNGWKVSVDEYLNNVSEASKHIQSNLFRPPYGRINSSQARKIPIAMSRENAKIIMWDVLSADFDTTLSPAECLQNVLQNTVKGSIIVFHDCEKAFKNMEYALPKVLEWTAVQKLRCSSIYL